MGAAPSRAGRGIGKNLGQFGFETRDESLSIGGFEAV